MPMKKLLTLLFVFIISVFVITTFITPISIASSEIYVWSPTSEPLNSVQTSVNSWLLSYKKGCFASSGRL